MKDEIVEIISILTFGFSKTILIKAEISSDNLTKSNKLNSYIESNCRVYSARSDNLISSWIKGSIMISKSKILEKK